MHIFQMDYALASWAAFLQYLKLTLLLIVLHYIHIVMLSQPFWIMNTLLVVTSALYLNQKQNNSLAPFKQLRFLWSPSQVNLENSGWYKTFHSRCIPPLQYHLSILPLTPTYILAPGELPRQFAFSFGPFPQAHKLQSMMWRKPITRFLSIHLSGQDWSSGWVMTTSPLTQASVLVVQHLLEPMVKLQMQAPTFSGHRVPGPYPSGWTIICSSAYSKSTSRATTSFVRLVQPSSQEMVDCLSKEAANGTEGQSCQMVLSRNLTKTCHSPFLIYQQPPRVHQKTCFSPTASTTSTAYPKSWEFLGNWRRTSSFHHAPSSSASFGTL